MGTKEINHPAQAVIDKHKGRIYPFSKLPLTAQLSIAHYMGVDGSAWLQKDDFGVFDNGSRYIIEGLTSKMDAIVDCYGATEIGYVVIPVEAMKEFWTKCKSDDRLYFRDFDTWHKWFINHGKPAYKKPTWPVILSNYDDEILQDGWNRFNAYIAAGATEIPAVWYPTSGLVVNDL